MKTVHFPVQVFHNTHHMKLNRWIFLFSTLVCSQTVLKAPTNNQPDSRLWNRERNVIELFFYFSPLHSFLCDWMCFIFQCGGRKGLRKRKEGVTGWQRVLQHELWWWKGSFTLTPPVFPLFRWLRHLVSWAWMVTVTLSVSTPPSLPRLLPSHPHILSFSLSNHLDWYLPVAAGIPQPIYFPTKPLSDHRHMARGKKTRLLFTLYDSLVKLTPSCRPGVPNTLNRI